MEESSETFDMFQRIFEIREQIARVRIYLLTDGIVHAETVPTIDVDGFQISNHIWDLRRFFRLESSGRKSEPIEIDFEAEFGFPIACLSLADPDSDYQGLLAVIPGEVLSAIYEKYGPRLLERNVRSFLQARGNVNKGIRKTILEEPHRFFAYNNGISTTADEIEVTRKNDGTILLRKVRNLQIVNGGQTTASLYHTAKKDKASLKGIYVQAKLSVIPPDQIDSIVPQISKYANSQNKVSDADFYANDPYHIKLEEFSRSVWAPAKDGTNRQSRWFYERARGQYLDAKGKEPTQARKRQFEATSPNSQKFTKTDLAKYENTWMQLPYIVSYGAQKNFIQFSIKLHERAKFEPDIDYFQNLIAKAILFRTAERLIGGMNFGGYRANIVTYTLAWISHHTQHRIDLGEVWKKQDLPDTLIDAIRKVSGRVHQIITAPPNGKNVTEWCKRKECWESISKLEIPLEQDFYKNLKTFQGASERIDKGIESPGKEEAELISSISKVPASTWLGIAKWAKETGNLQPWQRGIAFTVGKTIAAGNRISRKQAAQAEIILSEVTSLGFKSSA